MPISILLGGLSAPQNGQAVVLPPPGQPSGLNYTLTSDRIVTSPTSLESTQGQVLNLRYKVGGSGSWERPWGPV